MKKLLPPHFYNPVSLIGIYLSILSFGLIIFLFILDIFSSDDKPYMGILAFIVMPTFLFIGLFTTIFGIIREIKKEKRGIIQDKNFQ